MNSHKKESSKGTNIFKQLGKDQLYNINGGQENTRAGFMGMVVAIYQYATTGKG